MGAINKMVKFIIRAVRINKEVSETERVFCQEVSAFQKNADNVQKLTINHDMFWFNGQDRRKHDQPAE